MQPGDWVVAPFFMPGPGTARFGRALTSYVTTYWTDTATFTGPPGGAGPGEIFVIVQWLTEAGEFFRWPVAQASLSLYTPTEQDLADWLVAELAH